jgi:thiol-disulfide isomerase/thioredoxin
MTNPLHLFQASLILIMIIGCSQSEKPKNTQIIIAGKVENYNPESDDKLMEIIFNDILDDQVHEVTQIEKNGEFRHVTERPFPQDFMLLYGSLVGLYVSPGDSIYVTLDKRFLYSDSLKLNSYDLIKVSGTASRINSDVIKYHKYFNDSILKWDLEEKAIKVSTPGQYSAFIENRTKKYNVLIDKFNLANNTCQQFQTWVKYVIEYGALDDLLRYRWLYPIYNGLKRDSTGKYLYDIPKEYYSFLDGKTNGNSEAVVTTNYYDFLHEYFMYLKQDKIPTDTLLRLNTLIKSKDTIGYYNILKRNIIRNSSGFAQDQILSIMYFHLIKGGDLDIYEKVSESTPIHDKVFSSIIQKKYKTSKALFENPQILDGSHLSKISNNIIKSILDTISIKFKGNVLYIDFWAPWCSPCMSEMPNSLLMQKAFEGKNIRFVFLANRCTEQSWKATIAEEQITGEHFLLTDDQYKVLVNQFKIAGIPHYILVDKSGQIFKNDAPRPSDDRELKKMIQNLLDK